LQPVTAISAIAYKSSKASLPHCALAGGPMDTPFRHEPASRLEASLRAGRFVFTTEITPPVSCAADDLLRKALPLRGLADAVNVTDGASARTHMSALAAAAILARNGIEPVLQLACRDRNRIALARISWVRRHAEFTTSCC
jgi:5,10-methylenetetrahydrofolate reductase